MDTFNRDNLLFWQNEGLNHIKPSTGEEYPEGQNVLHALVDLVGGGTVREVGCGYGRLCSLFNSEDFTGYDINEKAIAKARQLFPGYRFYHWGLSPLPYAATTLLYTVLLHVDDNDIGPFCELISQDTDRVVVGEIMDTKWRRTGIPPVYNRACETYEQIFAGVGFGPQAKRQEIYPVYNEPITIVCFGK